MHNPDLLQLWFRQRLQRRLLAPACLTVLATSLALAPALAQNNVKAEPAPPSARSDATALPPAQNLDVLLSRLSRPPPTETPFVELRGSALLKSPQILRGRLQQPDAQTLVREVLTPFHERTTIRAERVVIERFEAGKEKPRVRTFSLKRAPELGGLLASFTALLRGNRALLESNYAARLQPGNHWSLQLTPLDSRLLKRVSAVTLRGASGALDCMQLQGTDGQRTTTLLGASANAAEGVDDATKLVALCAGSTGAASQ